MQERDARSILAAIRNYYKDGVKSTNKFYTSTSKTDPEKLNRRAKNAFLAEQQLKRFRFEGSSPGKAANCGEFSRIAAQFAVDAGNTAHIVEICPPGDHSFCVVDYPANARRPASAQDMINHDYDGTYVIDVWLDVCCRFSEYPAQAVKQFGVWSKQGKWILNFTGPRSTELSDPAWPKFQDRFFITGPLRFRPFTIFDRALTPNVPIKVV